MVRRRSTNTIMAITSKQFCSGRHRHQKQEFTRTIILLLKRKYNDYQSKITLKKTKIKKIEPGVGSRQGKKNTRFDKRVRMMTTLTIYYYYYYIDSTVSLRIYFFLLFLARIIYPLCLRKCIQFRINFPRVLAHTI